jgi:hypothetical protein
MNQTNAQRHKMKTLTILLGFVALTACTAVPNPKIAFGKKCVASGPGVIYSYVWVYDNNIGLHANEADCKLLVEKK